MRVRERERGWRAGGVGREGGGERGTERENMTDFHSDALIFYLEQTVRLEGSLTFPK